MNRNPDLIARFLDAAFQNIGDAELLRDLAQIARRAFVFLRRCPRDDFEITDLGKPRQNLVLDTIGEVGIAFFLAQTFKRQHRDRFGWQLTWQRGDCFIASGVATKEE